MTAARTAAARLRGGFVGATSASIAVAAHSAGGGAMPAGATAVLLLVACATVAAAAAAHTRPGLASVLAFVSAGQLIGHCVLTFASGHMHGAHWSLPMLSAHVLAAAACAVLICAAERLCEAALGELRRLIVVTLDVADGDEHPSQAATSSSTSFYSRILVRGGLGTRAPPASVLFA
jgi:hypothetical protein